MAGVDDNDDAIGAKFRFECFEAGETGRREPGLGAVEPVNYDASAGGKLLARMGVNGGVDVGERQRRSAPIAQREVDPT